jgi:succinyl-CoA synthetase beta subunit
MNIHEYQARELLARNSVAVPDGGVCDTAEAAGQLAEKLLANGASLLVVKSQIHAAGRGKGTFKSGYQGGVKVLSTAAEVVSAAVRCWGTCWSPNKRVRTEGS